VYAIRGGQSATANVEIVAIVLLAVSWFFTWRARRLQLRARQQHK
jgi:hypothetical protein